MNYLTIERKALLNALKHMHHVVSGKSTLPILGAMHMVCKDGLLTLVSTDLDRRVQVELPAEGPEFSACLGFRSLLDYCNLLLAKELRITPGEYVSIEGSGARMDLIPFPAEDFPVLDQRPASFECTFNTADFDRLLVSAGVYCSKEMSRSLLMGFLLQFEAGHATFVATDTHRMRVERADYELVSGEPVLNAIIPRDIEKPVRTALKAYKPERVQLAFSATQVSISWPGYLFVSRLMGGEFPKWEKVFPETFSHTMKGNRMALRDGFRRAHALGTSLKMDMLIGPDSLTTYAHQYGKFQSESDTRFKEKIDVQSTVTGSYHVAFNPNYFTEAVAGMRSEQVAWNFNGPMNPGVLREVSAEGEVQPFPAVVLMPMQSESGTSLW